MSLRKNNPAVSDPVAVMGLLAFPAAMSLGCAVASVGHAAIVLRVACLVLEFAGMLYGSSFVFAQTDNTKEMLGFTVFPVAAALWKGRMKRLVTHEKTKNEILPHRREEFFLRTAPQ